MLTCRMLRSTSWHTSALVEGSWYGLGCVNLPMYCRQ